MKEELERIVELVPAFDKRDSDPRKNYGVHGVELRMVLKGNAGAVQFVLYTGWMLPHVQREQERRVVTELVTAGAMAGAKHTHIHEVIDAQFLSDGRALPLTGLMPIAADLGYHSKFPMYEGQEPMGATKIKWRDLTDEEKKQPFIGNLSKMPDSEPTGRFTHCEYTGGPCYYDGSGLGAERVLKVLLEKGSEGVWAYLGKYYKETFGGKEKP